MFKDKILPLTYEFWDSDEACNVILKGVNFLESFGPWKDKEPCAVIKILYTEGRIQEFDKDGKKIQDVPFEIKIIKEEETSVQEENGVILETQLPETDYNNWG